MCEEKCTQKLPIIEALADTFKRAEDCGYSIPARAERIKELLVGKNYKKVGLYPNGGFAGLVKNLYYEHFGEPDFEWVVFNSNPVVHGSESDGLIIHSADEISEIRPDIILIVTYKYDEEIYQDIKKYEESGVKIVKLHKANYVPWVY